MTTSLWQDASEQLQTEHDDVVIGAGIVGAYAAMVLGLRGRDVALVDARFPAAGASGRNAGFVLTAQRETYPVLIEQTGNQAAREILDMVRDNVARMRALTIEHVVPFEEGAVHLAENQAEARELEAWARAYESEGVPVEFREGDPYGAGFAATMRVENDFAVHPARLTEAIAAAAGATLYERNEVHTIVSSSNHMQVLGRQAHISCQKVYIATNGYTGNLHPYLHGMVRPVRGQILLTSPIRPVINIAGITDYNYFRQFDDGRVLLGGARCFFEEQEYTAEDINTPNLLANLQTYFRRWFPGLEVEIERYWSGIHGFTTDRRAAVGQVPNEPRISFALGFSGYGNSIGLVAAERMVELGLDGRHPGPLSSTRFT